MAQKPKIGVILPDRIEKPTGGMGVFVRYLIKYLSADFEFSVYGFPEENNISLYHSVSSPLPSIRHGSVNTLAGQAAYVAAVLADVVQSRTPDLIHVIDHTEYIAGILAAKALSTRGKKVPFVASVQLSARFMIEAGIPFSHVPGSPDGIAIDNSMLEMEQRGLEAADRIIHHSNVYKQHFKAVSGFDAKSVFIPNGVDLAEFKTYNKVALPGVAQRKVLCLGRFASQKNIAALLHATIPDTLDLIFVNEPTGDMQLFDELRRKKVFSPNVHFLGPAYGQRKIDILRSADALIIPSLHECHPLVMHEGLAAGLIVLHSGAGDMKEVLTDDFAINCGMSPESISSALNKFSALSDAEIASRRARGFEVVKAFDWTILVEKVAEVYRELLAI